MQPAENECQLSMSLLLSNTESESYLEQFLEFSLRQAVSAVSEYFADRKTGIDADKNKNLL